MDVIHASLPTEDLMATALRAVSGETAGRKRRVTVRTAAAGGDRLALLLALRAKVAEEITGDVPARDLASLSRRLMEISKEIEDLEAEESEDDIGRAAAVPDEAFSAH
jgi:hypothetical protein